MTKFIRDILVAVVSALITSVATWLFFTSTANLERQFDQVLQRWIPDDALILVAKKTDEIGLCPSEWDYIGTGWIDISQNTVKTAELYMNVVDTVGQVNLCFKRGPQS